MISDSQTSWVWLLACSLAAFELLRWAFRWLWLRAKYDLHKIPSPKALSILGHLDLLASGSKPRNMALWKRWAVEFGKIFRLQVMGRNILVISDPEFLTKHVYGSADKDLPKTEQFRNRFNKIMTPHDVNTILTMRRPDAKYKSFRKTLACAFSSEALRKVYPKLLAQVKQCASKIESIAAGGDSIDIEDLAVRLTFDSIGCFAYGLNFDAVGGSHPLLDAMNNAHAEMERESWKPFYKLYKKLAPFSAAAQNCKRVYERLYREQDKVMAAIDVFGDPPAENDHSVRAQLMRLKNPFKDNQRATWEETRAEMALFLLAGTDTTSHQLTWIMMCLSTHLDVQDRLYKELKEHGLAGVGGVDPEYSILANLPYLNCVLKEGMRLIPAVQGSTMRVIQTDLDVLGYRIPKGTVVTALWSVLNTCPWLWENGATFDPDRWAPSEQKGDGAAIPGKSQKLWSFGVGARSCVGQRFATLELQLMLVMLLSKFRFTLDPRMGGFQGALDRGYDSIALSCEGGMWLRASLRV